ncbi:919_t:CDS:2 [Funneliformis geosporum]|uniref:8464_t:CDS:1 n=1 Tax=Funneliformis geosporum TaxID=1117311 RepID=A0A9W4S9Z3_9GLOM|nr:8464_t:CDS:2 [Funneliformis geosporum]CAI2168441.1 919_t:CDS:2 [Funneliformis geosporum]
MCDNTTSATYEFTFSGLAQLNKALHSPIFSSGSDQHLWQLWIQPADSLKDGEEYLSLYLCVIPNYNENKTVEPWRERMLTTATVYLMDPKTKTRIGSTISYTNRNLRKFSIRCSYRGREFFVKRSVIPSTKLVLGIEFLNVPFTENGVIWNDNICSPPESLVHSWITAVNNPRMADVLFQVQGEIICANKEIVCGRSEYFKAMFASGYVESRTISVAECGRLRKRLRDSTGNGPKSSEQIMESTENDMEELDKSIEFGNKDEEQRITKKQRSIHSESSTTCVCVTTSITPYHDTDGITPLYPQKNTTYYRNDDIIKVDDDFQIDGQIPESLAKSKSIEQEYIVGKQDRVVSAVIAKTNGPEAEVDDEDFPQDIPPGFYHVVNITDCDVPTFYALLHYLYTNVIKFSEPSGTPRVTSLVNLFRLADKYQITDLRQRALARIYKELAITNVAEVLFSLGHQWPDLKKVCMDYIMKHFATVRETEGFNNVMEHPESYTGFSEIAKDLFKKLKIADEKE